MLDVKHTSDGDLDFSTGDVRYDTSDYQHQKDILLSQKGYYKEHPELGADLLGHVNETDMEDLLRTVKKEFAADGMTVSKVSVNAVGELETDARYEDD